MGYEIKIDGISISAQTPEEVIALTALLRDRPAATSDAKSDNDTRREKPSGPLAERPTKILSALVESADAGLDTAGIVKAGDLDSWRSVSFTMHGILRSLSARTNGIPVKKILWKKIREGKSRWYVDSDAIRKIVTL